VKPAEFNDPMELVGVSLAGADLRAMARCLIEEYLLLGWDEKQLLLLFTRPCFRAPHHVYRELGEAGVRALIQEVCAEWRGSRREGEARHA
jgi:hypothetical protein